MIGMKREIICMVFSEVDVRIVDCVLGANENYIVRQWATMPRLEKSDIELSIDLKTYLADREISQQNVAITLPDSDFLLKTTSLPKIAKKDIKKYLDREVAKGLDLPIKACLYDFLVSNERELAGIKKIDLTVLGAPRELILKYAGIVMDAGLTPILIAPSSMAMFHLMRMKATPVKGPIAMIYLGANRTTITISDGDHVVFTRRLNLSLFTAVLSLEDKGGVEDQSDTLIADSSAADAAFDDAVREIKRTLLYCKKDVIGEEVVQVITAAAVPLSDAQITLLREKLNIEVLPWSLADQITLKPKEENSTEKLAEGYLFALGAAACAGKGTRLQILPWSLKWKRYESQTLQLASLLLLILLIAGLWNYAIQKEHLEEVTAMAVDREDRMALVEAARAEEEARIVIQQEQEIRQAILSRFREQRPDFQSLFQALSQSIPAEAHFDTIEIGREAGIWAVSLNGKTFGKESMDQVAVYAGLANKLRQSGRFSTLVFQPVKSDPESSDDGMSFQLRTFFK